MSILTYLHEMYSYRYLLMMNDVTGMCISGKHPVHQHLELLYLM